MPPSPSCNREPILSAISDIIFSCDLDRVNILDLGIGMGDFGKIIRKEVRIPARITGVEVWKKYRNRKWDYYDKVIIADIIQFSKEDKKKYDIILLIDVLEHFEREEGRELLADIIERAKRAVIISTPITNYPQKAVRGNPYEEHKSIWSGDELVKAGFKEIDCKRVFCLAWPPVAKLGIYIYKK